jgi:hypothetical protein
MEPSAREKLMALDIGKEITKLRQHPEIGQYLGEVLEKIEGAVNLLGKNAGVDPTGAKMPPPPPIQELSVKSDGNGTIHASISDSNSIQRSLHYFMEYDTDKNFSRPHVVHMGISRSAPPLTLPANDGDGNPQTFYFRAYSQYPGSDPGQKVHFGGNTPTAVAPGGSAQLTLFGSTGSGTAQNSGQEGGSGFGKNLFRPASTLKRTSAQE